MEILDGGHITIGSELVLALNWGALSDIMDTNPTYEWHRKWYEPYFYFQRDRIAGLITDTFNALMAFPNLIGVLLLSPVVFKTVQESTRP